MGKIVSLRSIPRAPEALVDVWRCRDTSDVKRILLGGSYAGAVAAGAVASAQLWLHAFTTDERSAARGLAVPSTHVRSVPVLVSPARPHALTKQQKPAAPSVFGGFTPIFASSGSAAPATQGSGSGSGPSSGGGTPATPAPTPTPSPGTPAPTPAPAAPSPTQPSASGGTAAGSASSAPPPTASAPAPAGPKPNPKSH